MGGVRTHRKVREVCDVLSINEILRTCYCLLFSLFNFANSFPLHFLGLASMPSVAPCCTRKSCAFVYRIRQHSLPSKSVLSRSANQVLPVVDSRSRYTVLTVHRSYCVIRSLDRYYEFYKLFAFRRIEIYSWAIEKRRIWWRSLSMARGFLLQKI